jgi:hypothetical protein
VDLDTLEDGIALDFCLACTELTQAKRAARTADTPAARARVTEWAHVVDVLLDMSNQVSTR